MEEKGNITNLQEQCKKEHEVDLKPELQYENALYDNFQTSQIKQEEEHYLHHPSHSSDVEHNNVIYKHDSKIRPDSVISSTDSNIITDSAIRPDTNSNIDLNTRIHSNVEIDYSNRINQSPGTASNVRGETNDSINQNGGSEHTSTIEVNGDLEQSVGVDPNACIILHPGSRNLRLGRPSDSVPFTTLHAIAWRHRGSGSRRVDPFIVPLAKMSSQRLQEVEECRLRVSHILQSSIMSDGTRRFATPPQQLCAYNKRATATTCPGDAITPVLTVPQPPPECIVGDQVESLPDDAPYHIHFPWQRGDLHLHGGEGGSVTAVLADLAAIWTHAIENQLHIPKDQFAKHRVVVVVPDLYNRDNIVHITELLLNTLNFAACFVFQDHVAATFGSGLGGACVVDVGDQKTSVSCVEDAFSHPSTRLRLGYGGSDVSQVLHWLLRKSGFPRPLNPSTCRADAALLTSLKHTFCHVNLNLCGPQEQQLSVPRPGSRPHHYTIQMGDERLIAPLSLCYPALLQLTGDKTPAATQPPNTGHHQDPLDDHYLRDTSRRGGGKEAAEAAEVGSGGGEEEDMVEEPLNTAPATIKQESGVTAPGTNLNSLMSLEQAILASIDRCSEEVKRRMYATVLLVGGGASNFEQLSRWLQDRLLLQIPVQYRPEQVEVICRAKDLDPGMVAWRGAALMTGLEGSGELWVTGAAWRRMGVRAIREKCPFIW